MDYYIWLLPPYTEMISLSYSPHTTQGAQQISSGGAQSTSVTPSTRSRVVPMPRRSVTKRMSFELIAIATAVGHRLPKTTHQVCAHHMIGATSQNKSPHLLWLRRSRASAVSQCFLAERLHPYLQSPPVARRISPALLFLKTPNPCSTLLLPT